MGCGAIKTTAPTAYVGGVWARMRELTFGVDCSLSVFEPKIFSVLDFRFYVLNGNIWYKETGPEPIQGLKSKIERKKKVEKFISSNLVK